ncbi:uncharacterized protein TRIREDRAFT_73963 [Trichoderma reesei QM6a]|uniref:Predicted protein n=2 Tax=Hypocrea jecorina TaxID=51453 RepID=G0R879_HYPJQ|nr:uncharacterized protein TRIREDRAFT_73963 [Trichoderma reesei QM6a]EGR52307.1 predicted protein [Trichoderma reesei QM6a]ETS06574.1 hypothetical protein M419DRAFT_94265 [Trichoderma reesei RUT C-30]
MEPLRLKPRQPVEAEIENWDDDDFIVDGDELSLRPAAVTAAGSTTNAQPRRRDSTSSHISLRSDLDSAYGEEQHVHLPADDERSTMAAIAAAERAGIPLPKNVPSSALTGGTIKRLGGKKMRKTIDEDWENDLELPDGPQGLQMKPRTHADFPETLRHVSGGSMHNSPKKASKSARDSRRSSIMSNSSVLSAALSLDRFRDTEDEEDDFFGDGFDTIKVAKTRPPQLLPFVTPPKPLVPVVSKEPLLNEDDFEQDLELPSDGTLRLSARRDIPRAPFSLSDDIDWGEGSSLGTRYGGTRRDARSTRSSSVSAMSPSLSSTFTVESEDETFDGLVLPPGHLNFQERLQLRKTNPPPEDIPEEPPAEAAAPPKKLLAAAEVEQQDFLEGLDIGDGNVFDAGKLTMHRNIKVKDSRLTNPARPKTSVTLTFSNKPMPPQTRIPRLNNHERSHSTALEPVSESGGPIPHRVPRRPQSRLGHAANQLSVTSLPTPTSATFSIAPAPRRAELSRPQFSTSRSDPPATTSHLLRQKRSLATVRSRNPPTTATKPIAGRAERPSSRTETGLARPKTPQDRQKPTSESPGQARKNSIPFIPAGASHSQSQHAASKAVRQYRRYEPDNATDARPTSRSFARPGLQSPSPHRLKEDTWGRLNRPKRKQNFGDGHELDAFDDLPTSKETESRFLKQPSAGGAKALRRSPQAPAPSAAHAVDRNKTPSPWNAAPTAARGSYTPSFARDTAASRIARETALAHRTPSGGPLASVSAQRAPTRSNAQQSSHSQSTVRAKKLKRPPQLKPHLISNLSGGKESKVVKGMFYNADTYRWEGNENVLNAFDGSTTPSSNSAPLRLARDKEPTAPRPALITNISTTKGVQVVGGMVFDPQNMCWLKLGPQSMAPSEATDSLDNFNGFEEEEDVFKDIPDLEDTTVTDEREGHASDIKDDWLVGEEFDVGPEFIRRQREEEERWRKKCEKWTSHAPRDREAWRWTIRELVIQFDDFAMPSGAR